MKKIKLLMNQQLSLLMMAKNIKVNDMPDEAKQLYVRWQDKRQIRDEFIIKANNDIDDLNTLLSSYEARMKNILEPVEEKKIEVSK